jgi:hypothetical protein
LRASTEIAVLEVGRRRELGRILRRLVLGSRSSVHPVGNPKKKVE